MFTKKSFSENASPEGFSQLYLNNAGQPFRSADRGWRLKILDRLRIQIRRHFLTSIWYAAALGKAAYLIQPPLPTASLPPEQLQPFLDHPEALTAQPLPNNETALFARILALKSLADHFHWRDFSRSRRYARQIYRLGCQAGSRRAAALGLMAYGDALAQPGRHLSIANRLQQRAADLFLEDGDLIGWARTCIGRAGICMEVGRVEAALAEADRAARVLRYFKKHDLLIRLAVNLTRTHYDLGNYAEVVRVVDQFEPLVKRMGSAEQFHHVLLLNNLGQAQLYRGDSAGAHDSFEKAIELISDLDRPAAEKVIQQNLAYTDMMAGKLGLASQKLTQLAELAEDRDGVYQTHTTLYLIEYELLVNRPDSALATAERLLKKIERYPHPLLNEKAHLWRYIGTAELALEHLERAREAFEKGAAFFAAAQADTWRHRLAVWQAKILLRQQKFDLALEVIAPARRHFETEEQVGNLTRVLLLQGQILAKKEGQSRAAGVLLKQSLELAEKHHLPLPRYEAHQALGEIAAAAGDRKTACGHFETALETLYHHQQYLTASLTADFMADKTASFFSLMALLLERPESHLQAFECLEKHRARLALAYLTNRDALEWEEEAADPNFTAFRKLRERHRLLLNLLEGFDDRPAEMQGNSRDSVRRELTVCETELQSATERLYLARLGEDGLQLARHLSLEGIREQLPAGGVLLSYFSDGQRWWGFAVCREGLLAVKRLEIDAADLNAEIGELGFHIGSYFDGLAWEENGFQAEMIREFQGLARGWYKQLITPFERAIKDADRLIIVPTSLLHSVPFNALFDGSRYLIEKHEIVLLPAASWLGVPDRPAAEGVHILAHADGGALPQAAAEGRLIQSATGGELFLEEAATRERLKTLSGAILHIAAHGEHRFDRPALSYIQLADGRLHFDDLRRFDLAYDLVVLNGCETGQGSVRLGEDVVGLGRGVLSGGARSVIATLWWVDDAVSRDFMAEFYADLRIKNAEGRPPTKAGGLRQVQMRMIHSPLHAHPANWAAYQLVGDGDTIQGYGGN